jgi:short-subunit dehydrogenase
LTDENLTHLRGIVTVKTARERRTALVTGASAGIGRAFADVFAARGFDLVLCARREDRLRAIAAELERRHGVRVHVRSVDLAGRDAASRMVETLAADRIVVDALVNNAGYAVPGAFARTDWQRQADFLQVMVVAVADLTHRLLPGMIERGYGRIINVASLAGMLPAPAGHTLYAASKAFVIRFSESLSHETGHDGVHVTAVCPGFTYTEFHDVIGTRGEVSGLPWFMWMKPDEVARQGVDAVMRGTPVFVNGRVNSAIHLLARLLPYRLVSAFNRRISSNYRRI